MRNCNNFHFRILCSNLVYIHNADIKSRAILIAANSDPYVADSTVFCHLLYDNAGALFKNIITPVCWTDMRSSIRQFVKQCKSCQINKRSKHSYGKLPTKFVLKIPLEALCVDLIGPYTIKGKDGSVIDFMCLTIIDPASSWFELAELPVVEINRAGTDCKTKPKVGRADRNASESISETKEAYSVIDFMCLTMIDPASSWFELAELPVVEINRAGTDHKIKPKVGRADEAISETKEAYFDKSSLMISNLVNKCWFSQSVNIHVVST